MRKITVCPICVKLITASFICKKKNLSETRRLDKTTVLVNRTDIV